MDLSFLTQTWWGALIIVVLCGHITVMTMSLYMHRAMAHQGLELHPIVQWAFRLWLYLFTGMSTREWVAVHRKHHAFCETEQDPHSPVVHGWAKILFLGVFFYKKGYSDPETMEKFSKGTPTDRAETFFIKHKFTGLFALLALDFLVFGWLTGGLVWAGQVLWTPFWAAGVVNGLGHTIGYRNYKVRDASRNLIPLGILLSGEELHNNHHKHPASAKFSKRWFEFDMGWTYIQMMRLVGLAKVKVVHDAAPNFKRATAAAREAAREAANDIRQAAYNATAPAALSMERQ
jgi:stearoyl-CoA desaturase (delta-9 desaturase)